ncbi:unnamed protein product [Prunus armeniaca]
MQDTTISSQHQKQTNPMLESCTQQQVYTGKDTTFSSTHQMQKNPRLESCTQQQVYTGKDTTFSSTHQMQKNPRLESCTQQQGFVLFCPLSLCADCRLLDLQLSYTVHMSKLYTLIYTSTTAPKSGPKTNSGINLTFEWILDLEIILARLVVKWFLGDSMFFLDEIPLDNVLLQQLFEVTNLNFKLGHMGFQFFDNSSGASHSWCHFQFGLGIKQMA